MKKAIILIFVYAICSFKISYGQEKLEVEGAIIIKNSQDPTPVAGTIRWTGTDFQGWNGSKWVSLTTGIAYSGEVTDIDGIMYPTIVIGSQEWMAQNLRTTRYKNGDAIPNVTNNTDWGNLVSGAYCWHNNDNSYEQPYGKLYNWQAVNDGRGLCPTGWHEPTDAEWTTLTNFLGGESVAAGPMKEAGTAHWNSPNTGATNESGFTGLPGGGRSPDGTFLNLGDDGYWWSSTDSGTFAWCRFLLYNDVDVLRLILGYNFGLSVRCVKD